MNPNYNPATAAAAQRAIEAQTQNTVANIEAGRQTQLTNPQREAAIAGSLSAVEQVKQNLRTSQPILRARIVVLEDQSLKAKKGEKTGEVVSFHVATAKEKGVSELTLDVLLDDDSLFGKFAEGQEYYLELHPVTSSSTAEFTQAGAGSGNGGPAPAKESIASAPQTLTQSGNVAEDVSVDPTTGTTGPQGTNDAEQRSNRAEGGPVDPNDPNATGPSTSAGQQTKGELKHGLQTGGTTGEGTGKGERSHESKTSK